MTKNTWLIISIVSIVAFAVTAYFLFADNKAEVIVMILTGAAAVYAANASGKIKIKEITKE